MMNDEGCDVVEAEFCARRKKRSNEKLKEECG